MLSVDPHVVSAWAEWKRAYSAGTLLLWPPKDQRRMIDAIRARVDPVTHVGCSAHITVTPPFRQPPGDRDWTVIERVLSRFEPFRCMATRLRSHLPIPVVWLDAVPVDIICALRAALVETGLFIEESPYPDGFQPHVTVTEGRSERPVDEGLVDELIAEAPSVEFDCRAVGYAVPDADFRFRVDRFLPLGADPKLRRVDEFIRGIRSWAERRPDCRGLALVGSHARGEARPDSDVDVVLIVEQPDAYLDDLAWVTELGPAKSVALEPYGKVTSVRIHRNDGIEAELGIAPEGWAARPYDPGTWEVATDGLLVLFARDRALVDLSDAAGYGAP